MLGRCFSESGREGGGKEGSFETEEDEVGMESCVVGGGDDDVGEDGVVED